MQKEQLNAILRSLKGERVEFRNFEFEGEKFYMPYQTISYDGGEIQGLRQTSERGELFKKILNENGLMIEPNTPYSYLDVGSNMGFFPNFFSKWIPDVTGVEYDPYYVGLARQLYPEVNFLHRDLNKTPISAIFPDKKFDVITSLSMIEYIDNKERFVKNLHDHSNYLVIVEGHSLDINSKFDDQYEKLLKTQDWEVTRRPELTDNGVNAPDGAMGRPVWVCKHK